MIPFLKLIRWPNLLIVGLSMLLILFCVIRPGLGYGGFEIGLSVLEFLLLVAASLFIAIGGYLINDFYDMNADSVNKPGVNQVGRKFPVYIIDILYWVFTITGIGSGALLSWHVDHINYSLIFVFSAGLLWFYSSRYQCQPIVGNVVIAFLSALSFGLVWIFEFFALSAQPDAFVGVQQLFGLVNQMVFIYVAFAFMVSFLREVVKDMEDIKGDDRFGCRTFSVVYGLTKAKWLSLFIALVGLLGSVWVQIYFYQLGFHYLFIYFFVINILFLLVIYQLVKASETKDFSRLSSVIKTLMLAGILSMPVFYFEI